MYRDCSNPQGSGFDSDASFGIYRYDGNQYTYVKQLTANFGPITKVLPDNNPCLIIPPGVCVEESSYQFQEELPIINETYVIYYMRCCRNNTIINLVAPNNTGATFFIEISPEAQQSCNNSPRFKSFPPIVICADFPFDVDHSAVDKEGDSLIYEFCTPYAGGGPGTGDPNGLNQGCTAIRPNPQICTPPFNYVSFISPLFDTDHPMGMGILTLDRFTGMLSGTPKELGQYVVGICVKEYRAGKLIGSIHRDFQFNIGTCEQSVFAKVKADTSTNKNFSINYCGDRTVKLTNESYRVEYIKSYDWIFISKTNPKLPTVISTDRDASITFPEAGQYKGLMIVNRNAPVCSDTAYIDLNIIPSDIKADFDFEYDKCSSLPIAFNDKSIGVITKIKDWTWDFKDGTKSSTRNPKHIFSAPGNYPVTLKVTDGKICKSELSKEIAYFPAPQLIDILPDRFRACAPATIHFKNLSIPLDSTYQVEWDFGDGLKFNGLDAMHIYEKAGSYSIALSIKAPSGCISKESFPAFVNVQNGPMADFDFSPKTITTRNSNVQFNNLSRDALQYSWNFGDHSASVLSSPVHQFKDTGTYTIVLTAQSENGCQDTAIKSLEVDLSITYFLPNAFSPNNDGINDEYIGTGSMVGMHDFNMSIYNRWGELIFFTKDPTLGWNGRKNNAGSVEPDGVYVCTVRYKTNKGENRELTSFATLVR